MDVANGQEIGLRSSRKGVCVCWGGELEGSCVKGAEFIGLGPCLFNLYAECIMRKAGLDEAQAGIKTARSNINNLRYADAPGQGHLESSSRP